ncbi:MAG: hypothetical protein ACR2JK_16745 [Geodermatophilaceae bacterium]
MTLTVANSTLLWLEAWPVKMGGTRVAAASTRTGNGPSAVLTRRAHRCTNAASATTKSNALLWSTASSVRRKSALVISSSSGSPEMSASVSRDPSPAAAAHASAHHDAVRKTIWAG